MKVVVDTNILVSFFRENPVRRIILSKMIDLYTPEYAIEEIISIKKDVIKYSKSNEKEFESRLNELSKEIKIVLEKYYRQYRNESKKISPHEKDDPFFALALFLKCSIWSKEPGFRKQSQIEIVSTKDLLEVLSDVSFAGKFKGLRWNKSDRMRFKHE